MSDNPQKQNNTEKIDGLDKKTSEIQNGPEHEDVLTETSNKAPSLAESGGQNARDTTKRPLKRFSWYQAIIALVLVCVITFMSTYTALYVKYNYEIDKAVNDAQSDVDFDSTVLDAIKNFYEKYYVGDLGDSYDDQYLYFDMSYFEGWDRDSVTDVVSSLYVAWTGDTYGQYYSPREMDELNNFFNGETVGIGVMITYSEADGSVEVLYTMDDSPAQKAGITAGDYIVKIGDVAVADMTYDEITSSIQGEAGSKLEITVMRDNEIRVCELTRETVVIKTVFPHMAFDGKTGIIKITEFTAETPEQFISAVETLEGEGASRFVFDLRDNPGGLLSGVLGVLSYILPKDTRLIKEVDKYGNESYEYCDNEHIMDCPMSVLVNSNTASAAELFTINMRDYDKAEIVGTKTFGKGVVQSFYELPNGGMLKLTTMWYSSALSGSYDKIGINPDYTVEMDEKFALVNLFKISDEDDNQLQYALGLMNGENV